MSILEKIRQMPDNQKKIFSLITAVILTLVIVVVWFSSGDKDSSDQAFVEESKLSSISPVQVIKDEFSKAFASLNKKDLGSSTVPVEIIDNAILSTSTELEIATNTASTTITSTSSEKIN